MGLRSVGLTSLVCLQVIACGDDGGLSDYYPPLPDETGEPQSVFAGEVTEAGQLVGGPAQSGLVGDFYIKNDRVTFIVQAPTRVIGVIPQGGNVVDAVLTDGTQQIVDDHFGELSMIYLFGRTCDPEKIEIVRDGAGGGVAVLRAVGKTGNNDFINIKGIGALRVDKEVDPDIDDQAQCATTYILAPGSNKLEVHHSLFNSGPEKITGPLGTLSDSGGHTEAWTNGRGFERAGIESITTLGTPQPSDYVIYQGPGVAYGVIPRHETPTAHTHALIAGVSILLDGNESLLDILDPEKWFLSIDRGKGIRQAYDLVVGKDAADIDEVYRGGNGEELRAVSGRVDFPGGPALGARVGVFLDGNGNGQLDEPDTDLDGNQLPDDRVVSYMDVAPDGTYSGMVPTAGSLLVRAEVKNQGRSPAMPAGEGVNLAIPAPLKVDFTITDAATDMTMPGRLLVIGDHLAHPDKRVFETYDRLAGVVEHRHSARGTSLGASADEPLYLPPGGTYRIYASRGTEWSAASQAVSGTADVNLTFQLAQVNPTPGYIGSDWHVHQVGSPDSNVLSDERIKSAVSAGVELFAVTDHDYVSDLQPLVEQMGLASLLRVMPGIEVTPFAYGHFNSWPIAPEPNSANRGAIDWARGSESYAMTPGQIFNAMRERGAQMVQVNHPRGSGFTEFQASFSRANVKYDFDARTIFGDYANASTPHEWLRLPEESLWSDQFNALEVWNGFSTSDTNMDGTRENVSMDRVLRDWFSMLSLGLFVTPSGSSDTHTTVGDPVGMPRTYVRVPDDSASALSSGAVLDAVLATQTGASQTARDIVVTNGPMIDVKVGTIAALGSVFAVPANEPIVLTVKVTSPTWAEFDTLEVFANTTPDPVVANNTALVPLKCWTTRDIATLNAADPCKTAPMVAQAMSVQEVQVNGQIGARRYEATITVTLDAADIVTRAGATGRDAWLVFRVRGDRAIFPVLPSGAITPETQAALLAGDEAAIRTALTGKGAFAAAFTTPVFVDFDGNGYRAPFAP